MTPRLMVLLAPSASSPPNRGEAVGKDLRHRNAHWSFIIWSCDGERMLQIQNKPLNLGELGGFTKWWKKKGPKRNEDKQDHSGNPDECVDISWWKGRCGKCINNYFPFFGKFRRLWLMGVFCSGIISLQIEAWLLHEIYHVTLICPHTVQQKQLNVWIGLQVPDRWY